jgi:hypothetical protein
MNEYSSLGYGQHPDFTRFTLQAEGFIAKHGLEFRAVLIGNDCPLFCEDAQKGIDMDKIDVFPRRTHIHGKHYRCTFSRKDKGHFAIDFWNSYADEEQNYALHNRMFSDDRGLAQKYKGKKFTQVEAYDVIACITKNDPGSFEDFCSDFGYDTDSKQAEATYWAVVKEFRNVKKFFTDEELAELQEIG